MLLHDRKITFYIREKNPHDLEEACKLYKHCTVLTNYDGSSRPSGIKGVNETHAEPTSAPVDSLAPQCLVTEATECRDKSTVAKTGQHG